MSITLEGWGGPSITTDGWGDLFGDQNRQHKELDLILAFQLSEGLPIAFQAALPIALTFQLAESVTLAFDSSVDLEVAFTLELPLVLRLRIVWV